MLKKLNADLHILKRGFLVVQKIQPGIIFLNIVYAIFEALTPFISIYLSAILLNELSSTQSIQTLTYLVLLLVVLNFIVYLIKQLLLRYMNICNALFEHKFIMHLNEKVLLMDYNNVENFNTHMKRQKIDEMRNMNGGGVWFLVYSVRNVLRNFFTIIFAVTMTYSVFFTSSAVEGVFFNFINSPITSIFLLTIIVTSVVLTMSFNSTATKKMFDTMEGIIPFNRIFGYISMQYINTYNAGKDIRMYNQKNMVINESLLLFNSIEKPINDLEKNQISNTNINSLVSILVSSLVYIYVAIKAIAGLFPIGDILRYVGSINQFISGLSGFMNSFTELRNNNECLIAYFNFIDIPNKFSHGNLLMQKTIDKGHVIEFHNVSFKYPDSDTYVLNNINLKIKAGQHLAVVGMNGSGKTTMIKLLCRLYDPTEGIITIDGVDIKSYNYDDYLNTFSVIFQDFSLFSFSLGQNISADINYDETKAMNCLEASGLKNRFSDLSKGLETSLYKDFEEDGVEVSGGEAQKIALARALYKNPQIIILDEPTASLDPIAEFEIYSKFNEIAKDITAVYISHRLSSCRFCDEVVVFHEGELIQRGNHDELVRDESGKYYELWSTQSQYYL